ncbi:MAG: hypothetical protein PHR56_05070 [Dehalococcoidales bacterium]|nr:hypothetical protein [Dehalococcoidales bacterium]
MKKLFGQRWYFIIIVVIVVLGTAILVQNFKSNNCFAKWLFNFLNDWAMVLSAFATLLLAFVTVWTLREGRRSVLGNRLNEWARKHLVSLNSKSEAPAINKSKEMYIYVLKDKLNEIVKNISPIEIDSAKFDEVLYAEIKAIIDICKEGMALKFGTEEKEEISKTFENYKASIEKHLRFIIEETS